MQYVNFIGALRSVMIQFAPWIVVICGTLENAKAQALADEAVLYVKDVQLTTPYNRDLIPKDLTGYYNTGGFTDIEVKDYVRFSIEKNKNAYIPPEPGGGVITYELTYSLAGMTWDGTSDVITTLGSHTLTIRYDPENATVYNDIEDYWFEGYYKFRARVTGVKRNGTAITSFAGQPFNLCITAGIMIERYYDFDPDEHPATFKIEYQDDNTKPYYRYLKIKNFYIPGATAYDIEWTYSNDYSASGLGTHLDAADVEFAFHNNSTRIRVTSDEPIYIPAVFDRGYVIARVRGIGRNPSDVNQEIVGSWNVLDHYDDHQLAWKKVGPLATTLYVVIGTDVDQPAHEANKNWMFQSTFAETGKMGNSITYYDGTLRSRQSLALNNAEHEVNISEVFYDYQGRAAVQTLPAPYVSATGAPVSEFKYYENLNKTDLNPAITSEANPKFDRIYFDEDDDCTPVISPMAAISSDIANNGVATYYSEFNSDNDGFDAFIPDAFGYPYTLTQFTPDNTNRVRKQSGIGINHIIGSGHEITYLYGKPTQIELDRMFGNNVGIADHYFKNAVIDPNGQVSVSYLDMKGNVVATAIAGEIQGAYDGLTEVGSEITLYGSHSELYPIELLLPTEDYPHGAANREIENGWSVSTPILVVEETTYSFSYSVEDLSYSIACISSCFDCVYDLKISLLDDCGNELLNGGIGYIIQIGDMPNPAGTGATITCEETPLLQEFDVVLPVGSYTLVKEITVNQEAIAIYTDVYIDMLEALVDPDLECFKPLSFFEEEAAESFNFEESCNFDCTTCSTVDNLEDFLDAYPDLKDETGEPIYDEATINELYEQFTTQCEFLCTSEGNDYCSAAYSLMLVDMGVNGQYGEYINPATDEISPEIFPLSIFNEGNLLQERTIDATTYSPSWKNPIKYFDGNWHSGYYDEANVRSSIVVISAAGGGYLPALEPDAFVFYEDGVPHTYPEYIVNVDEFIARFQLSWSSSLVVYHPEYYSYEYCIMQANCSAEVGVGSSESMNTFQFDEYLLNLEYDDLATEGLLGTLATFVEKDPLFNSVDAEGIVSCYDDITGDNSEYYDVDRDEFISRLVNYEECTAGTGYTYNIYEMVWLRNTVGFPLVTPVSCSTPPDNDADLIVTQEDWLTFVSLYISAKQQYILENIQRYTMLNFDPENYYSGCIGNSDYSPFDLVVGALTPTEYFDLFSEECLCSVIRTPFFIDKTPRFGTAGTYFGVGPEDTYEDLEAAAETMTAESDYMYYVSTGEGNMPLTGDLQLFLNGLIVNDNWSLETVDLDLDDEVEGTTLRFFNFLEDTWSIDSWTNIDLTASDKKLIWYEGVGGTGDKILELEIPAAVDIDWNVNTNDFLSFQNMLNPDGDESFTVEATYLDALDVEQTVLINGTSTFLDFGNEDFLDASITCDLTPEANSLFNTMAYLTSTGIDHFDEATYTMMGETAALQSSLGTYLGAPDDYYTWGNIDAVGKIYMLSNDLFIDQYIKIFFSLDVSTASNFKNFEAIATTGFIGDVHQFSCTAVIGGVDTYVEGYAEWYNPISELVEQFPVADCDRPISTYCDDDPHYNAVDLFGLLNKLASTDISTDDDITFYTEWTNRLKTATTFGLEETDWDVQSISDDGLELVALLDAGTGTACTVTLRLDDPTGEHEISEIEVFQNLQADYTGVVEDVSYSFTATATIDGNDYLVYGHTTCIPLKNCFCDIIPTPVSDCSDLVDVSIAINSCDGGAGATYKISGAFFGDTQDVGIACSATTSIHKIVIAHCNDATEFTIEDGGSALSFSQAASVMAHIGPLTYDIGGFITNIITDVWIETGIENIIHIVVGEIEEADPDPIDPAYTPAPESFEAQCTSTTLPFPGVEYDNPCDDIIQSIIDFNALTAYNLYIDALEDAFQEEYKSNCLDALEETLDYSYTASEYQYTLYYYDQSNNLVMTVPPAGVQLLPLELTDDVVDVYDVAAARATLDDLDDIFPKHVMKTQYHYNTLNELIWQITPDAGVSEFWYDALGRLVLSQNAKQNEPIGEDDALYSYSRYDELGRVFEVGQCTGPQYVEDLDGFDDWIDDMDNFPTNFGTNKEEVVITFYDAEATLTVMPTFGADGQENLRNRIASVFYQENYDADLNLYDHATHYSYDIHGNVKSLIQDNKALADDGFTDQQFKKTEYQFDLISGNVHYVRYQLGEDDRFTHHYLYDANNRLYEVQTTRDDVHWEKEARYFYYRHGPLARMEIGDLIVQGVDYAYTIQGWLKGANASALNPGKDMGRDGKYDSPLSPQNSYVGRDVFGFILDYYKGDYQRINSASGYQFIATQKDASGDYLEYFDPGNSFSPDLFNGNIRGMSTALMNTDRERQDVLGKTYRYDQLNRIKHSYSFIQEDMDLGGTSFTWEFADNSNKYTTNYTYDANGNILTHKRTGNPATGEWDMDDLTYIYYANSTTTYDGSNQLAYVSDAATGTYSTDIDDQTSSTNYEYDEIGNLTADEAEGIESITWTVSGKIKSVNKTLGPDLYFAYDALGNRISKKVEPATGPIMYTYYARDAQGNILAVYNREDATETDEMALSEQHIYGAARIGYVQLAAEKPSISESGCFLRYLGEKQYELSNHLGNVLVVVSDRRFAYEDAGAIGNVKYYESDIVAGQDYDPLGNLLEGRNWYNSYRFGFNDYEYDHLICSLNSIVDYGERLYDTRIGRYFTIDPLTTEFTWQTPYSYCLNNFIALKDNLGCGVGWTKNNTTGEYVWDSNVTSKYDVDLKEGFGYIGENNSDIIIDLFGTSNYTTSDLIFGTANLEDFENKYQASGGAAYQVAIRTYTTVSLSAKVSYDYKFDKTTNTTIESRTFLGVNAFIHISGSSSYPTEGNKPYETPIFTPVLKEGSLGSAPFESYKPPAGGFYSNVTDPNNTTGDLYYEVNFSAAEISSTFGEAYTLPLKTDVTWMSGTWTVSSPTILGTFGVPMHSKSTIYLHYHNYQKVSPNRSIFDTIKY